MTSSQMLSPPVIRMTPPLSPSQSTEPATRSRDAAPVATHSPPASRPIHLSLTRLYGTADGLYGARPYSPSPHTFSTRAYHMLHEYELATEFPFLGHSPGHSPRLSPSPITFSPPPRAESYPKPIPGSTGHAEPPWRNSLVEWNNQFEPSPSQRDHLSPAPPPGRSKADDYFGNWEAFTKHAAPNTTHGENLNVSPGTRYDPDAPVSPMEGHSPDLTSETGPRSSRLHDNASQPKLPSSRNIYSPPTFSPCQVPKTGGNDDSPRGGNRTFGSPLLSPQTQSLAESVVSPHTQTSIHHLEVDDTRSPEGMIFWSNRKESDGRSQVEGHGGIRAVEGDVEGAVYMRRGKSSLKRYQDAGSPKTPVGKWFSRANRLTLKRNGKNSEETSKTVAASGRTPFSFKTLPRITSPRLTFTNDSKGCNSPVSGTAQGADGCPISRYSPTETGSPIEQHPTPSFEPSSPVSPVSTLSSALDALLVTPAQSSVPLPLTIAKFDDHRDTYPSPAIKTVPDTTVKSKPLIDHTRQRHDSEVDPIVAKAYRGLWLSFPDIDKPLPEVPSHGSHSSLRVEAEAPRHQATCTSAAGRSLHDDDDSSEDSSPSAPSTPPSIAARELACHRLDPIFTERFIVRQELGAGGFGFVCTAIGTGAYGYVNQKDREFAVKFLYKEKMSSSSDYSNRFRLPVEAYVLNRCDHPNIVKLIDVFEDEKFWYIVQELGGAPWVPTVDTDGHAGANLTPLAITTPLMGGNSGSGSLSVPSNPSRPGITRRASHDLYEACEYGTFTDDHARVIFRQVANAVGYLHARGIYHRDIKDENIVIDRELNVKLIDFGAAVMEDPHSPASYYTTFRGTKNYISSECLSGLAHRAAPTDIWSLGVLLCVLLTGTGPWEDLRHCLVGMIRLKKQVEPLAFDLIKRCLNSNPDFRITIRGVRNHPWVVGDRIKPLKVM